MSAPAVRFQRSVGEARVLIGDSEGRARERVVRAAGSAKLRFPTVPHGIEALVLNTSGGLASGDRFATDMSAEAHRLTVSTLACERVYRCEEGPAEVTQRIAVAADATVRHLPQPTILFEGARLRRLTRVDLAEGANLTLCEGLVLGRAAMGETVTRAEVRDRIEVRIAGRLAFVDAFGLSEGVLARAAGPALLAGARGVGLVIHVGALGSPIPVNEDDPSAGSAADVARVALCGSGVRWGASTMGPVTVVRVLAPDHTSLQDALGRAAVALSGAPLPRAWQL